MRRSLYRPAAVLAMSGGLIFGSALPAFAHHPILSASTACNAGQQVITWKVQNSQSSTTMTVNQVSISSGTVSGLLNAKFTGNQSKTFTTSLPGTDKGTVKLTVWASWTNGVKEDGDESAYLKGDCKPPVTTTSSTSTTTTSSSTTSSTTTTTQPTTTTTSPTTSTTEPTTTTTTAPTTSTTEPTTTTTTAPTTSTTEPPTTPTTVLTTSSTAPTTTSTVKTEVLGETVTKPANQPEVAGEQAAAPAPSSPLAHTGAAIGLLAFVGGGLLWIGVPLTRYKRKPEENEGSEG